MTDLKVVQFDPNPSLQDIPGHLRAMADRIEAGEYGEVDSLIAVMPRVDGYPVTFGWGSIDGRNDPIIQFSLALQWNLANLTART